MWINSPCICAATSSDWEVTLGITQRRFTNPAVILGKHSRSGGEEALEHCVRAGKAKLVDHLTGCGMPCTLQAD